ncbi:alpha/beta fold hydrolase [Rhizobacter sp. P5_C2]
MNPFFFGTRQRRLFGVYSPARASASGSGTKAVLLCPPWGQEYLRAHRAMKQLATLLNQAGVHVLRFDWFGTGDSAGEMLDASLAGWQADIETAIDELKDTTDAARVGLVGLRLGGTLAAGVAARRRKDVDSVVLWDPVVSGEGYLKELLADAPARKPEHGGGYEVMGFALGDAMAAELRGLALPAAELPARTLVIRSVPGEAIGPVPVEQVEGQPAWLEDHHSGAGAVPVKVLQRIAQWWS